MSDFFLEENYEGETKIPESEDEMFEEEDDLDYDPSEWGEEGYEPEQPSGD